MMTKGLLIALPAALALWLLAYKALVSVASVVAGVGS